jgi:hypothetical protein
MFIGLNHYYPLQVASEVFTFDKQAHKHNCNERKLLKLLMHTPKNGVIGLGVPFIQGR